MPVDQSLFGFRSEHLIGALSAPHQYANAGALACCTYSAPWILLEASVTSAEAARGRAFIDHNIYGRAKPRTAFVLFSAALIRVSNHDCPSPVAQRMPDGTGGFIIELYGRG